jgi:hypothetical protein
MTMITINLKRTVLKGPVRLLALALVWACRSGEKVAAHGERIWLKKNTTQGATFTFTLPVHQSSELSENN